MTASRTIVLAPRLDVAKVWCLEHHVAPHGRNTRLCSTRDSVHPLMTFREGDWLVVLPGTSLQLIEALAPAFVTAPDTGIAGEIADWLEAADTSTNLEYSHVFGAAT